MKQPIVKTMIDRGKKMSRAGSDFWFVDIADESEIGFRYRMSIGTGRTRSAAIKAAIRKLKKLTKELEVDA